MEKYYKVSFQYSETTYCTNIAHAESIKDINEHYSKYEWFEVTECPEYELEIALRKGTPLIEIEPKQTDNEGANTMPEFTEIKKIVTEDKNKKQKAVAFYIENGFYSEWSGEHRTKSDEGLRNHSTETRWNQYKTGVITREKAVEFATKRAIKEIERSYTNDIEKLDKIAHAKDLEFISISIEWVRSRTWGYNPYVEIRTNTGIYTGKAGGWGYDKESAAIADAFNTCDSILKALYTLKENGLRAGLSDTDKFASCGRSNGNICGYGAGYGAIPYFEGGVGSSCFWSILKKCGFETTGHHGKHMDFYEISKEV